MRRIDVPSLDIVPDPGPAPMLQWIEIQNLVVDDSYQRELKVGNWKAIRRIAQNFKWSRFSPVFVAPVEGGAFAIIDGQHRTHAAAMCGFASVPCQVVQMTLEEQAASFAAVNGLVTKVTLWQILKAASVAGEPWAADCVAACADADCRLMFTNSATDAKKPGEIYPVGLIRSHVAAGRRSVVTLALSGVRRSEFGREPVAYTNPVIRPLIEALADRPWLAAAKVDLARFCDSFDIWAALDEAEENIRQRRRRGETGISHWDLATAMVGEGLDRAFPQRMALPAAGEVAA